MAELKNGKLVFNKITSGLVVKAYYLAGPDGKPWDDVISIYTGLMPWNWGTPPVSHEEIGFFVDGQLWFFSSASRSAHDRWDNGTRWIKAEDLLRHINRWTFQTEVSLYYVGDKIERANDLIGMPYDYVGVIADFISPIDLIVKKKSIYCSKACHKVDINRLRRICPRHEWKVSAKAGWDKIKDNNSIKILMGMNFKKG